MSGPTKPGLGDPEGSGLHPRPRGKATAQIESTQIEATKAIEISEDAKDIEIARIHAEVQRARYQTMQRVAIAVVVCTVAALAVVYGRSFSSSILSIGEDGETKVETKTQGAP